MDNKYNKMEDKPFEIPLNKITKYMTYICIFYLFFWKYAFDERRIILYGTAGLATLCMIIDLLISRRDILAEFPWGVLLNPVMCVYSIITGIFIARNEVLLISAVKTYAAFSLVTMAIAYVTKKENSLDWFIDAIIIIDIISSIYVIANGTFFKGYGYILGPEQNPNNLGLAMNLGLFCVAFRARKDSKNVVISCMIALLFLYTIIECGSRKNLIASMIICVLWLIPLSVDAWKKSDWRGRILLIIVIGIATFLVVYYYNNYYVDTYIYNRMERLGAHDENSSASRIQYYKYAIEFFLERPVFGIGLIQYQVWNPLHHAYAHSTYAEALADWGIVGCTIYFMPAFCAGFKLMTRRHHDKERHAANVVFALWAAEIFLGIGQIWFYEIEHMIAWTVIYSYLQMTENAQLSEIGRKFKYVKA